jgi:conjugal transfer pilus assembly protein TraI
VIVQAKKSENPEIKLDGAIGEALKALVQDILSGDKRIGEDALVDAAGHILLRWPDAFSGYGLTAKGILDELSVREWLWIDPMAPLKKVLDGQLGGASAKVIRLEREISGVLIQALGDAALISAPAGDTSPDPVPPPRNDALPGSDETKSDLSPARHSDLDPKREKRASKLRPKGKEGQPSAVKDTVADPQVLAPDPEGAKSAVSDTFRPGLPTLEDVLAVLWDIPMTQHADGWRALPKREAIATCRKRGMRLTHGHLDNLAQQDTHRLALDGVILRYKARIP